MSISVAMAVYNGEKYLKNQLNSILLQLSKEDEIVISYDESDDHTLDMIKEFFNTDSRIKLFKGPNKGVVKNFENAIKNCKNEYIFLSDQDDIWLSSKVSCILNEFDSTDADLILHDAEIVNEDMQKKEDSFFKIRNCGKGIFKNIIKNSYIGCCMAFKSKLKEKILPFPDKLPMHDQWIGLIAEKYGKVVFLNKPLIKYRRHHNNASRENHSSFKVMLKWRLTILKELFIR